MGIWDFGWGFDPLQAAKNRADNSWSGNENGRVDGWAETQKMIRLLGRAADLDGDGHVSRDEVNFLKRAANQGASLREAKDRYNNDWGNFNSRMGYDGQNRSYDDYYNGFNRRNDLDGDGYTSSKEQRFSEFAQDRGMSRMQASKLFRIAEAIAGRDGKFNWKERMDLRNAIGGANANALIDIFGRSGRWW